MSECTKPIMGALPGVKFCAALRDRLRRKRRNFPKFLSISVELRDKRGEKRAGLCCSTPRGITVGEAISGSIINSPYDSAGIISGHNRFSNGQGINSKGAARSPCWLCLSPCRASLRAGCRGPSAAPPVLWPPRWPRWPPPAVPKVPPSGCRWPPRPGGSAHAAAGCPPRPLAGSARVSPLFVPSPVAFAGPGDAARPRLCPCPPWRPSRVEGGEGVPGMVCQGCRGSRCPGCAGELGAPHGQSWGQGDCGSTGRAQTVPKTRTVSAEP